MSTFIYSICRPLRVLEAWSHDANMAVAMEIAWRTSRIDFQLECSAKQSYVHP